LSEKEKRREEKRQKKARDRKLEDIKKAKIKFREDVILVAYENKETPIEQETLGRLEGLSKEPKMSELSQLAILNPADFAEIIQFLTKKPKPSDRVWVWLAAAAFAALLPLLFTEVTASWRLGFYEITANGDLFVISAVLLIAGLGELTVFFWRPPEGGVRQVALSALGMTILVALDCYYYGSASSNTAVSGKPAGSQLIAYGSLAMFAAAAMLTAFTAWKIGDSELCLKLLYSY
jgi:hypothetical protein